jgi:hypothetical protein
LARQVELNVYLVVHVDAVCLVDLIRAEAIRLWCADVLLVEHCVVVAVVVGLRKLGQLKGASDIWKVCVKEARLLVGDRWRNDVKIVERDALRHRVLFRDQVAWWGLKQELDLGEPTADQNHDERTQELAAKTAVVSFVNLGAFYKQSVITSNYTASFEKIFRCFLNFDFVTCSACVVLNTALFKD